MNVDVCCLYFVFLYICDTHLVMVSSEVRSGKVGSGLVRWGRVGSGPVK